MGSLGDYMINIWTKEFIRVWVVAHAECLSDAEDALDLGVEPSWYEHFGLDELLIIDDIDRFLLTEGIAEGQPFQVEIDAPTTARYWTDCGYEYDYDVDWAIVQVLPWSRTMAASAWEKSIRAERLADLEYAVTAAERALRDEENESRLVLVCKKMSRGISLQLRSGFEFSARWFCSARSDDGNFEEALSRLRLRVQVERPGLIGVDLASLPVLYR